jgi:hypothetical protein
MASSSFIGFDAIFSDSVTAKRYTIFDRPELFDI